jgi:hypothetical protein
MKKTILAVLASMLSLQTMAAVGPIYVDAGVGNTFRASDDHASAWQNTAQTNDGIWRYRSGFSNNESFVLGSPGNDVLESSGINIVEDCVAIYTVASGLVAGQAYYVDVVYWTAKYNDWNGSRHNWNVKAGFALDSMLTFDALGTLGTAGTLTGKIESDRSELLGRVGQLVADANGQIRVYIDDLPATVQNTQEVRTWYDGILVTAVPEPATLVLLGLGGLMSLKRRRA